MNPEIILYVLFGFLILLVIMAVPLLFQLWQAIKQTTAALHTLNERLPTILRNLEEITTNVNGATRTVNARVEELSFSLQRVNALVNAVLNFEQVARSKVTSPLPHLVRNTKPLLKGVYTFWKVLNKKPD